MKIKTSKTLSNILILTAVIIGFVLAFHFKADKWAFCAYSVSVSIIVIHSLFVFLGNKQNKKTVTEIIEKAKDSELVKGVVSAILKKDVTRQVTPQVNAQLNAQQNKGL